MEATEPILIQRAALGDANAFGALVEGRWVQLVGLARSIVGEAEAEDAVQDALIKAWRKLGSLREETAFKAWLARIVLRSCLQRVRSWRDYLPLSAVPEPVIDPDPGDTLDVERLVAALAPRQRAVMHLSVVEGRTDTEIAELMRITAASVRSHRRRARERLSHLVNGVKR